MPPTTPGFKGTRLREAREARALSMLALGELIGVRPQMISMYENDHHAPSPATLERISAVLRFPRQFFTMPIREEPPLNVAWRSMSDARSTEKKRIKRKMLWLSEVISLLDERIEFPAPKLPTLNAECVDDLPPDEDIEDVARNARVYFGLSDKPIRHLMLLLENHGVVVVRWEVGSTAFDGMATWQKDRPFILIAADKQCAVRESFSLAHELGHLVLHSNIRMKDKNKSDVAKILERQANIFASAFLLPESSFARDVFRSSLEHFLDLKPKWHVAIAAMIMRASSLGLISEFESKSLWRQLSRRGWRKKEPLDDQLECEVPRLIPRAFNTLLDANLPVSQIVQYELGLNQSDVESVCGLAEGFIDDEAPKPLPFRLAN